MQPDLLIFHLNGTVIDTSGSVDSVVRRTVQLYLTSFLGIHGSGAVVGEDDLQRFRAAGRLDDPYPLTLALLRYVLSVLPEPLDRGHPPTNPGEAVVVLKRRRGLMERLSLADVRAKTDFAGAAARIRAAGGGLEGVTALVGEWEHPLLMDQGEVGEANLVRHLFQEIYLGRQDFGRLEKMHPRFYRGPGLRENERLLLGRAVMEHLRGRYRRRMGAVTEWTHTLASLSLHSLKLDTLFDVLVTAEDLTAEEARHERRGTPQALGKPHPFMLLEAAAHLDPGGNRPALYLGNTPDDMRAARAAAEAGERPFVAWAMMTPTTDREWLKAQLVEAGAERIIEQPVELEATLLAPSEL